MELSRQPLPAVEADLHGEREPGLNPHVHEAEDRVQQVVVDMEALARTQLESALLQVWRSVVLEAHAGLDGLERADQPRLFQRMLREQLARQILFARAARGEVEHRASLTLRLSQCRLPDPLAGAQREVLEVEQADLRTGKEHVHASLAHQRQQRAAKHEAVESRQHTGDERGVTGYEGLHGSVLFGAVGRLRHHLRTRRGRSYANASFVGLRASARAMTRANNRSA